MSICMYIYVNTYTNDTGISHRHLSLKNQISSDNKKRVLEEKILSDIKYVTDGLKVSMARLWYRCMCMCVSVFVLCVNTFICLYMDIKVVSDKLKISMTRLWYRCICVCITIIIDVSIIFC